MSAEPTQHRALPNTATPDWDGSRIIALMCRTTERSLFPAQGQQNRPTPAAATLLNTYEISSRKNEADEIKMAFESRAKSLLQENEELKQKIQKLEFRITDLHQKINELNEDNDRIKERLKKTEKEKQQLSEALDEAKEQEREALEISRGLENQLDDTKRSLTRISHEHQQLSEMLKDESNQKEQLRNLKNEMENERWQLDKTIERLQKEAFLEQKLSIILHKNSTPKFKEFNYKL
ncbi:unnamed protein product [Ranitomeya imitator]|uniref:Uncharacterized protein n=1 Tax=Ranitomeya imitator TaxID=111125 RepID=A0ABN9LUB3_9NEOB|nr:unnamed protein product [Ranitomeya imitator]